MGDKDDVLAWGLRVIFDYAQISGSPWRLSVATASYYLFSSVPDDDTDEKREEVRSVGGLTRVVEAMRSRPRSADTQILALRALKFLFLNGPVAALIPAPVTYP